MHQWLPLLWLTLALPLHAGQGRYLTWLDERGQVQNTFLQADSNAAPAYQAPHDDRVSQRDGVGWSNEASQGTEAKRRYFTWVDASGALQSSFHTESSTQPQVVPSVKKPLDDDYVDSEWLEEHNFQAEERSTGYYTWVDDQGRVHNSPLGQSSVRSSAAAPPLVFSEGRQVDFSRSSSALPVLGGPSRESLQLSSSPEQLTEFQRDLLERCCEQLPENNFIELSVKEPRFEELNHFSPRLRLPKLDTRYIAVKLPPSTQRYGLRVRSFANRQLVYPSLLFLDESRRPTRLVSEAVSTLHPESWHRYAYLEGVVPVYGGRGERYVLLLTTDEDRARLTLDSRPYKRPLQAQELNDAGIQVHRHGEEGSFELMVLR